MGVGEDVFSTPGKGITGAGTLKVTVIEAKDYNPGGDSLKPYVILKLGDKEHKTSHRPKSSSSECSW